MSTFSRIVVGSFVFLLVVGGIVALLSYRLVVKSLPNYSAEIPLPALQEPVTVYWDQYKVPHIFANSSDDLFRAAGYIAAQERLWQMDLMRRAASGRLSEVLGRETLDSDKLFRTLGFRRAAVAIVPILSPQARAALEAYCDGINQYIERHRDRLPIEFSLLGYAPEAWEMVDSITLARLLAFQLSFSWHVELTLHLVAEKLGYDAALELLPQFPADAPLIISEQAPTNTGITTLLQAMRDARRLAFGGETIAASNSWAVAGVKSHSGKPILANDPHLPLGMPSVWYEMHLRGAGYNVMGMAFPGAPGIVIGRNESAAWGLTNAMIDDLDFYFERVNPQNREQYYDGEAWREFEILQETFHIRDEDEPEFMEVRISRHGPVVSDVHPLSLADSLVVSIRWTGHELSDEIDALLDLNRAATWEQFVSAVSRFRVPAQNFIYADSAGTIGYAVSGTIPIRRDGRGYMPYMSWEPAGDWIGAIPFNEMPKVKNPAAGFIATANNRIVSEDFKYYLGHAWEPDSRIRRIHEVLESKSTFGVDEFKALQNDLFSHHAFYVMSRIRPILSTAELEPHEKQIWHLLDAWDCIEHPESAQAAIHQVFVVKLLEHTLLDQMGEELYNEFLHWTNFPIRAIEHLLQKPESIWWNDVTTTETETMEAIVIRSFRATLEELGQKLGGGPGNWDWGRLHQLTFRHPLGEVGPLNRLLNRGPYAIGGSANTVAKAEFRYFKPYNVDAGASLRHIVELRDPQTGLTVIAGGQSGQPFSDHYDDQIELWLQGAYKVMRMRPKDIEATATHVLHFRPANTP